MRYSVESVPCKPIIRKYVDGGSIRQHVFVFASRDFYDADTLSNMDTAKFYEEFSSWIEKMDKMKKYPTIKVGKPTAIEVLSTGYVYEVEGNTARFQLQCRLVYKI